MSLSLPRDDGNLVTVPAAGNLVVIDFWGPTCKPCKEELPRLVGRKAELEARGATLVLVAVLGGGESTEDARAALVSWGVGGERFLIDRGGASQTQAGVRLLPATLIVDQAGALRWVKPASASIEDVVAVAASFQ